MKKNSSLWMIFFIWLSWALIMVGYQFYVRARFQPQRPDYALSWTGSETRPTSQNDKPYLIEPFLNDHVSWDSEYYLSIAVGGYNDPTMRAIPPDFDWSEAKVELLKLEPTWISMNYAFLPFYPFMVRLAAFPLKIFGLNPTATATLAGVLVSILGALGAMIALYDITRDSLGEAGGRRAAFYLLILPASMFLAEVYTEGLFLGLSFGTLALARRQKWVWAAILAAGATWTRAAGLLLILPMAWYWWKAGGLKRLFGGFSWSEIGRAALVVVPLAAYLVWNAIYGSKFHIIEAQFFSRGLLKIPESMSEWSMAFLQLFQGRPASRAYYLVEFAFIAFGFVACVLAWKRHNILALYSLATLTFSLTSGVAQGMHRYALAAPVIFLLPAQWGENEAFDRAWTLGNTLLMGVFAAMFAFDFWAGEEQQ